MLCNELTLLEFLKVYSKVNFLWKVFAYALPNCLIIITDITFAGYVVVTVLYTILLHLLLKWPQNTYTKNTHKQTLAKNKNKHNQKPSVEKQLIIIIIITILFPSSLVTSSCVMSSSANWTNK